MSRSHCWGLTHHADMICPFDLFQEIFFLMFSSITLPKTYRFGSFKKLDRLEYIIFVSWQITDIKG